MRNNLYYFRAADVFYYDHRFHIPYRVVLDSYVNYTWSRLKRWL